MTLRTFRQNALGYGSTPAQVVCQIDGNTVFSGSVTTLDQPMPNVPNADVNITNIAWTWQDDADFSGTKAFSVMVTGAPLLLAGTSANDPYGNVESFRSFYTNTVDGVNYNDPFTNETIDGVSKSNAWDPALTGQWWWVIPAGSTFTATMHVDAPPPPPLPPQ